MKRIVFTETGEFEASRAAEDFLAARGFSVGHTQRGAPRGVLFGDFDIQKWRNLSKADRLALHGHVAGDGRLGPVTVALFDSAPPEAWAALESPSQLRTAKEA